MKSEDEIMRDSYDFSSAVRGKHHQQMRDGHTVTIHHADGTTTTEKYEPPAGTIVLDPDIRPYFPDSESVNRTLRSLIGLIPSQP
jgi:hypothetical protein